MCIDPAVYPYNLENIYPSISVPLLSQAVDVQAKSASVGKIINSSSSYPYLEICMSFIWLIKPHTNVPYSS